MRHEEVGERPRHHQEEIRIVFPHAPELERLQERFSWWQFEAGRHDASRPWTRGLFRRTTANGQVLCYLPVVHRLLNYEEGKYEQSCGERKFDIEEETPRVSAVQHIASEQGAGGTQAEGDCVVTNSLASFVKKEDVVDKLDRQGFTDSRAYGLDDPGSHETVVGGSLGGTDETCTVADQGQEHNGTPTKLVVHGHQEETPFSCWSVS